MILYSTETIHILAQAARLPVVTRFLIRVHVRRPGIFEVKT